MDPTGPRGPQRALKDPNSWSSFGMRGILAECMPSMDFMAFLDEKEGARGTIVSVGNANNLSVNNDCFLMRKIPNSISFLKSFSKIF